MPCKADMAFPTDTAQRLCGLWITMCTCASWKDATDKDSTMYVDASSAKVTATYGKKSVKAKPSPKGKTKQPPRTHTINRQPRSETLSQPSLSHCAHIGITLTAVMPLFKMSCLMRVTFAFRRPFESRVARLENLSLHLSRPGPHPEQSL